MKKRIALCVIAAVVVVAAGIYIFFYFNGIAATVWKLGFSNSDVVTSFDVKDGISGEKIVLLNSNQKIGLLALEKNALGIWRKSSYANPFDVVLKSDKKNRYAMESYSVFWYLCGTPYITSHLLLAGVSKKEWKLDKIVSPQKDRYTLKIKCFNTSRGQVFWADASGSGFDSGDITHYIEQKAQSGR